MENLKANVIELSNKKLNSFAVMFLLTVIELLAKYQ